MAIPIGHSLFGLAWAAYPIVVRQHWVAMISIFCLIELKLETTRRPWIDSPLHLGEAHRRTPPGVI
jgi:hypothetical protein